MKPDALTAVIVVAVMAATFWSCAAFIYSLGFRPFGARRNYAVPWTIVEVLLLAPMILAGFCRGLIPPAEETGSETFSIAEQIALLLVITLPFVLLYVRGAQTYQMGLHCSYWRRNILLGFVAFLMAVPLIAAANLIALQFFESTPHRLVQVIQNAPTLPNLVAGSIGAVIIAPFLEELSFRGILLPWLRRVLGPWPAILISSFLFAIAHFDAWPAPIALFVLAGFLGYLAYRTTSLVAPIVLHATFNAANMALLIVAVYSGIEFTPPTENEPMRSPELMTRNDTGLLVIDVQTKLMDKMRDRDAVIANVARLIDGAAVLGMTVQATEQYPKGIGPTVPELVERLPVRPEKLTFSCCGLPDVAEQFRSRGVQKILLAGIETHVCVQQTALDLIAQGFRVYVAADAVTSRVDTNRELALRRMERAGVVLTTTEAALFEWTERAGTPEFKQISKLVISSDAEVIGPPKSGS